MKPEILQLNITIIGIMHFPFFLKYDLLQMNAFFSQFLPTRIDYLN